MGRRARDVLAQLPVSEMAEADDEVREYVRWSVGCATFWNFTGRDQEK